jgi:amino-acid N-acetyltransferase
MDLVYKKVETEEELSGAYAVRRAVFIVEQKVPPELEYDEWDEKGIHAVALADGKIVGTGRLYALESEARIGRLAVLPEWRGQGAGEGLMRFLMQLAREQGLRNVVLAAQTYALDFYRRFGFVPVGDTFSEANIEHQMMIKPYTYLRKARLSDVSKMHKLLNHYAKKRGAVLPRSLSELCEHVRDYFVVEEDGQLVGCCALHLIWEDIAEVRSLAVHESARGKGWGRHLLEACLTEAREMGLPRVFALTYIPRYFERFGFVEEEKSRLPQKIWAECFRCPKFPDCGEVAMVRDL